MDGRFGVATSIPAGWFHVVVNFIGPNDGQGLQVYYDGVQVRDRYQRDTSRKGSPSTSIFRNSTRRILIGRLFFDHDDYYTSVQVDEMFFFNQALTETEITGLSQYRN